MEWINALQTLLPKRSKSLLFSKYENISSGNSKDYNSLSNSELLKNGLSISSAVLVSTKSGFFLDLDLDLEGRYICTFLAELFLGVTGLLSIIGFFGTGIFLAEGNFFFCKVN